MATKTWNVMKLVGTACKSRPTKPKTAHPVDAWILTKFSRLVEEVELSSEKYRFDQSMAAVENFLWHEFADHYIELVKHRVYGEDDEGSRFALYTVGLGLLKMISVFLPHVAEDAYQMNFRQFEEPISIHVSEWPTPPEKDEESESMGEFVKEVVSSIRSWKASCGLSLNAEISRVEVVGHGAKALTAGSEEDMRSTVKARELVVLEKVDLVESVARVKPLHSKLGPSFKKDAKEISAYLVSLSANDVKPSAETISVPMKDGREIALTRDYFEIEKAIASDRGELEHLAVAGVSVLVYR